MSLSKAAVSGSTNGLPIKVTGTNDAGKVTVHTGVSGTTDWDFVNLYAHVDDAQTTSVVLTLSFDNGDDPDDLMHITLPAHGTPGEDGQIPILEDHPIQNGKVIYAYAGTANVVMLSGTYTRHAS